MAGLLYSVNTDMPLTVEELHKLGFPFAERAELPGREARAPGEPARVVFALTPAAADGRPPAVGYYPERQRWRTAAAGRWSIGWYEEDPPTPADLRRGELYDGYSLTLRDGNSYVVPVARQTGGGTGLPRVWSLDDYGAPTARVDERYRRLYELAWRIWETMGDDREPLTYGDLLEAVGLALSVNYYLTREELLALELVGDDELNVAVGYIIDRPAWQKLLDDQKKKSDGAGAS